MTTNQKLAIENWCQVVGSKLPPAKLKGNGREPRYRLSKLVSSHYMAFLRNVIPKSQITTVSIYRGRGYGGDVEFTSGIVFREIKFILDN
jgi:hypothetical protein